MFLTRRTNDLNNYALVAKKIQNEKLIKVSMILLKQGFMALIIFNIFNIAFSAGVHFKYANP